MNISYSRQQTYYPQKATLLRLHPIGEMLKQIRKSIKEFPKAMLFELRDQGYHSLFEQICACIISVRTLDEVSLPAALKLFSKARTPEQLFKLSEKEIYQLIRPSSFGHKKAKTLKSLAKLTLDKFQGQLPSDYQTLSILPGLGPIAANRVLGTACQVPALGVDIHVHRITNRWGYLHTKNAEESLLTLASKLPKSYWIEVNELLVPFGKNICTGKNPKCSICPVFQYCERRGVKRSS